MYSIDFRLTQQIAVRKLHGRHSQEPGCNLGTDALAGGEFKRVFPRSAVKSVRRTSQSRRFRLTIRRARRTSSPHRRNPHLPHRRRRQGRDRPWAANRLDGLAQSRHGARQGRFAPDRAFLCHQRLAIGGGPKFRAGWRADFGPCSPASSSARSRERDC